MHIKTIDFAELFLEEFSEPDYEGFREWCDWVDYLVNLGVVKGMTFLGKNKDGISAKLELNEGDIPEEYKSILLNMNLYGNVIEEEGYLDCQIALFKQEVHKWRIKYTLQKIWMIF